MALTPGFDFKHQVLLPMVPICQWHNKNFSSTVCFQNMEIDVMSLYSHTCVLWNTLTCTKLYIASLKGNRKPYSLRIAIRAGMLIRAILDEEWHRSRSCAPDKRISHIVVRNEFQKQGRVKKDFQRIKMLYFRIRADLNRHLNVDPRGCKYNRWPEYMSLWFRHCQSMWSNSDTSPVPLTEPNFVGLITKKLRALNACWERPFQKNCPKFRSLVLIHSFGFLDRFHQWSPEEATIGLPALLLFRL